MKNDDDALFCAGCGSVMSKSQPVQPQTESNLQSQTEVYAQQEGNVQLQAEGNTQSEQDETVQPQQEVNVSEETYEVSLEKAQTEETASETAENTVEPMSSFGEPVQVESVEPRNFSQPQFGAQQQNIGQPQFGSQPQFGTQSQSFGHSQFGSQPQNFGQPSFGGPQFSNPQPVNAKKFSVKRFVFSALIIIASILACACVAFNYVGIKMSMKVQGEGKETQKQYIKGYKIIKDKADVDLLDEMDE
ncbi:MAG: hypothetical protein K2N34_10165, partial [Lachnospiraceae bacterium]|nr:hypothetical protein [Lachnospiraceae bacterium]